MKKCLLTAVVAIGVACAGSAQARVCEVDSFNTDACLKGDEIYFAPPSWGNEQLPIKFIAYKCDFTKHISWTKGGVACVYAGKKIQVYGGSDKSRIGYAELFAKASSRPSEWIEFDHNSFGRIAEMGDDGPIRIGDSVNLLVKSCKHTPEGVERPDPEYTHGGVVYSLAEDNMICTVSKGKPTYGTVIELVSEKEHGFMKLERVRR